MRVGSVSHFCSSIARNEVLLELIRDFIRSTRRYELALMRGRQNATLATDDHNAVIHASRCGDLDRAITVLRRNLSAGLEPIREWLAAREGGAQ